MNPLFAFAPSYWQETLIKVGLSAVISAKSGESAGRAA